MSVFNPTSVLNQFHANIAAITSASPGKFTRSAYRFTLDKEPDSGPDGLYFVDLTSVEAYSRKFGTGENVSVGHIAVRVAYFRGGGNLGEGDRFNVMRHAADDCQLIADVCENPENYNSSASGISVVVYDGFSRIADLPKTDIWEARFTVQWRSDLQTAATIDLMVANIVIETTAALSALAVGSLRSGTSAVMPATAGVDPRQFILDKDNVAGDVANGDDIIGATGTGSPVWREVNVVTSASDPVITTAGVMTVGGETTHSLQALFEADRGVTFGAWASGDGPVASTIADQSGRGSRDLTAVGTPIYIGSSINGLPGIRTSPTTPSYHRNTLTNLITTDRGPRTVFFVGKASSAVGGAQVTFRIGASGQFMVEDLTTSNIRVYNGTDSSSQLGVLPGVDIDGVPHIWEWSYDGRGTSGEITSTDSAVRLLIDGVPVPINTNGGAPAGAENGTTGFILGSRADATQFGWLGEWSLAGIFDEDLPFGFRNAYRASLSRKYGIEVETPATIMWAGHSRIYGTGNAGSLAVGGPRQRMHELHTNLLSVGSVYAPSVQDGIFNRCEGYPGATSGKAVGAFGTFIGGSHWVEIMAATKPAYAALMIGVNDFVADSITPAQTAQNVLDMVQYTGAVSPDTRFIIIGDPRVATNYANATTINATLAQQWAALQAILTPTAAPNVLVSPLYGNVVIPPVFDDSLYVDGLHFTAAGSAALADQALHPFFVSVGL